MKKGIILALALAVLITSVCAACASKTNESDTTTTDGLENYDSEFGFETDEDGNEVAVEYETDEDGNVVAYVLDSDGNHKKDSNGKDVTLKPSNYTPNSTTEKSDENSDDNGTNKLTTTSKSETTATTKKKIPLTDSDGTTKFDGTETVPKTTASGDEVTFSEADQEIISSMLEVPYLYQTSYENSDGVPIDIACRVAVWMEEHNNNTNSPYPSGEVVLNLFKYFGQTVVNFKTQCNDKKGDAPISYDTSNDTFSISEFTPKKQTVKITKIEDLGDNNFYKVTADVSGCNKKKVVAIVQKNRLESTLGFSIKALKWS